MSRAWLRGPCGRSYYPDAQAAVLPIVYFFIHRVLGYTLLDEVETGSESVGDFDGMEEQSGIDGVMTNSDFTFTATSASFSVSDIGKFLAIKDSSNEVNNGVYRVIEVVSSTQVIIDFMTPLDYPSSGTGLSWWLFDSGIGAPSSPGSSDGKMDGAGKAVIFRSPNATYPFEMHISYSSNNLYRLMVQVAVGTGGWDTVAHSWKSDAKLLYKTWDYEYLKRSSSVQPGLGIARDGPSATYIYGNTEGTILFGSNRIDGRPGTSGSLRRSFWIVAVLDPVESGKHPNELIIMSGGFEDNDYNSRNGGLLTGMDVGGAWSEKYNLSYPIYWCGWRDGGNDYFKRTFTLPNHRARTEYDGLPILVAGFDRLVGNVDQSYFNPDWSVLGRLPKDHIWLTACNGIGELEVINSKQNIHWREGVTTPWPGVNIRDEY